MARYARPGGSSARQRGASRPGTDRKAGTNQQHPQAARRGAPPHTPRALTARFRVPGSSGRSRAAPRDLCTPRKTGCPPSTPPRRLDRSCRGTMIASPFGIHFPARPPFGRCRKVLPPARVPPMTGGSEIPARESRTGSRRLPHGPFRPRNARFGRPWPAAGPIPGGAPGPLADFRRRRRRARNGPRSRPNATPPASSMVHAGRARAASGCVPRMPAAAGLVRQNLHSVSADVSNRPTPSVLTPASQ